MPALRIARQRGPHRPRCRGRFAAIAVALAAALLVPAASRAGLGGANDYTLDLDLQATPKIGGEHIGTIQQAARAFGRPRVAATTVMATRACRALWPRLGLAIDFAPPRAPSCSSPHLGRWLDVVATGRRWHTVGGLHVGDREARLRALYPSTRPLDFLGAGHLVELKTGGPYCDGGPPLALAARVGLGLVRALLVVRVPACG
jgi:hypothetical protein